MTTTGTTYDEAWTLHREDDKRRIQILRYGNQLEYCETECDGRTTGHEGYIDAPTMPAAVLGLIRAEMDRGYRLVAHEQYDPEQLLAYLSTEQALDIERARTASAEKLLAEATAERDQLRQAADADHRAAQRVREDWDAGRGQCDDCTCCTASGCRVGLGSTCPTDRLGDSVCPCTGE